MNDQEALNEALNELYQRRANGQEVFAHAELTCNVTMHVWNGRHPVETNTLSHVAKEGTRVLITMFSRFGDVGIRDNDVDNIRHGYTARVTPEMLRNIVLVK